jgi:hypothetical protein
MTQSVPVHMDSCAVSKDGSSRDQKVRIAIHWGMEFRV